VLVSSGAGNSSSYVQFEGVGEAFNFEYGAYTHDNGSLCHYNTMPFLHAKGIGSSPKAGGSWVRSTPWTSFSRTQSGTRTIGSDTITGLADTSGFFAGLGVSGTGIPNGARVGTITATTITLRNSGDTAAVNVTASSGTDPVTVESRWGANNSFNQGTYVIVDDAPGQDPQGIPQFLKIAGYRHVVNDFAAGSGTHAGKYIVNLRFPWPLQATIAGGLGGTAEWIYGSNKQFKGGGASMGVDMGSSAEYCGLAVHDCAAYGGAMRPLVGTATVEVFWAYGSTAASALKMGGSIMNAYAEAAPVIIGHSHYQSSRNLEIGPIRAFAYDPTQHFKQVPRASLTNDARSGLELVEFDRIAGYEDKVVFAENGANFSTAFDPASIAYKDGLTTTVTIPYVANADKQMQARLSTNTAGLDVSAVIQSTSTTTGLTTVLVTIDNPANAGAIDPASGALTVFAMR
jgi:hypothetical protein